MSKSRYFIQKLHLLSTSVSWVETLWVQAPAISALFLPPPLPGVEALLLLLH